MNYYEITITVDNNWPSAIDTEHTIRAGRLSGKRILGWWTTTELNEWLKKRCGSVISDDGNTMIVLAQLTKKETK
jgi:hypothetical protein